MNKDQIKELLQSPDKECKLLGVNILLSQIPDDSYYIYPKRSLTFIHPISKYKEWIIECAEIGFITSGQISEIFRQIKYYKQGKTRMHNGKPLFYLEDI